MKKILTLLAAALFLLPACEKINREDNLKPEDFTDPVPIELTKADQGIRDASNSFGMKVFGELLGRFDKKDISFSPLSLSLALAMAGEGAAGETFKQFADVIGWENATKTEVGDFYKKMIAGLVTADPLVDFSSSNSFWAARDFKIKNDYKSLLEQYFAAESYSEDFSDAATVDKINKWCSDKTDGKIPQMLTRLDPELRLMLINALLFKAPWHITWEVKQGRPFQGLAGKVQKDYLYAKNMLSYGEYDDYEYVAIPYGNGAYEMDIVLPKEGKSVRDVLPEVEYDAFQYAYPGTEVELYLPKWSTDFSTEDSLIPILKSMGMTLPFSDFADFSGMADEALCIGSILQKVRIDVSEKGTEFAAVTVIGVNTALPVTPKQVILDLNRPFAYFIREKSSNTLLLAGTLSN